MELSSSFWDSLDSAEADYLKSLLEAVSLFQLQLRQNERLISEAKELLGEREAACERLRFGAARAKRAAASAAAAAAAGRQELRRLEAYEDVTSELRALQKQRGGRWRRRKPERHRSSPSERPRPRRSLHAWARALDGVRGDGSTWSCWKPGVPGTSLRYSRAMQRRSLL
ncbi:unnamed protein product [Effrenium voratum]|nr:unnamed protein product [Effrenium voratum]